MSMLLRDILDGVRAHAVRATLIVTAVALGASALTVLLAITHGLELRTAALVQQLGERTFVVLGNTTAPGDSSMTLNQDQARLLRANLVQIKASVVRYESALEPTWNEELQVVGTDSELATVRGWRLHSGRFLDEGDVEEMQHDCVIVSSMSTSRNLNIGDTIILGTSAFHIVGVVDTPQSSLEAEVLAHGIVVGDTSVFVPYTVEPDWITDTEAKPSGVDAIFVKVADQNMLNPTVAEAQELTAQSGVAADALRWVTPISLAQGLQRIRDMVTATAGGIALLSLVLGGITLASLLLANVHDRVAEIGLRRAFGARRRDIVRLFVAEALGITCLASLLGTLVAATALSLSGPLPLPAKLDAYAVLAPVTLGMVLGVVAAWWPASVAASVEPAFALRGN